MKGQHLDDVSVVRLTGPNSFNETLNINDKSDSLLSATGMKKITLGIGTLFNLVLADAHGSEVSFPIILSPTKELHIEGSANDGIIINSLTISTTGCSVPGVVTFDGAPDLSTVAIDDIFTDESNNVFKVLSINNTTSEIGISGSCTFVGTSRAFIKRAAMTLVKGHVGIGTNKPKGLFSVQSNTIAESQIVTEGAIFRQENISIAAFGTALISVPDFFTKSGKVGEITITAARSAGGIFTVKIVKYTYVDGLKAGVTELSSPYGQASREDGGTGGAVLSAVKNGNNLDITLDMTAGASAINGNIVTVYRTNYDVGIR